MTQHRHLFILFSSLLAAAVVHARADAADSTSPVNFARDVRPILANNCFHCHGPDAAERKADLRLDVWESAGDLHGAQAVIDGKSPGKGELLKRILSEDADERMPPADSGKMLRPEQVAILKQWISEGGKYEQHWAFVAPKRPEVPVVKNRV